MEKRLLLLAVVLMVVGLFGSTALALDLMGPPTAGLKQGQFSAGLEYIYSTSDLVAATIVGSGKARDVYANKMYARLGYGVADNLEVDLLLGVANATWKASEPGVGTVSFAGDTGFAHGFGTKVTLYEDADLKLGGLFQMTWADCAGTLKAAAGSLTASGPYDLGIREMQLAVGGTYRLAEGVSLYGGPFFHVLHGDLGMGPSPLLAIADLHEAHSFGCYVGTGIDVADNIVLNIEYQYTGAPANALGMYLALMF